jgi:hypothetical protein
MKLDFHWRRKCPKCGVNFPSPFPRADIVPTVHLLQRFLICRNCGQISRLDSFAWPRFPVGVLIVAGLFLIGFEFMFNAFGATGVQAVAWGVLSVISLAAMGAAANALVAVTPVERVTEASAMSLLIECATFAAYTGLIALGGTLLSFGPPLPGGLWFAVRFAAWMGIMMYVGLKIRVVRMRDRRTTVVEALIWWLLVMAGMCAAGTATASEAAYPLWLFVFLIPAVLHMHFRLGSSIPRLAFGMMVAAALAIGFAIYPYSFQTVRLAMFASVVGTFVLTEPLPGRHERKANREQDRVGLGLTENRAIT